MRRETLKSVGMSPQVQNGIVMNVPSNFGEAFGRRNTYRKQSMVSESSRSFVSVSREKSSTQFELTEFFFYLLHFTIMCGQIEQV